MYRYNKKMFAYRISNEGLCYYAREMGYLDSAFEESLSLVRGRF